MVRDVTPEGAPGLQGDSSAMSSALRPAARAAGSASREPGRPQARPGPATPRPATPSAQAEPPALTLFAEPPVATWPRTPPAPARGATTQVLAPAPEDQQPPAAAPVALEPAEPVDVEPAAGVPASPRTASRSVVLAVVLGALVLQMSVRLWGAVGGWFLADDFWRQDLTTRADLSELAFSGLGGHLSPLMWAVLYPFTALTLFNWPAQVVFMVGLWLVIDLLALLVFRRLWGWGWPTAVAFAVFAVSTFTAPSFLWSGQVWLGGLNVLGVVAMLLTVFRAVARPSLGRLVVVWLTIAATVLLSERNALDAVFVGLCALVAYAPAAGGVRAFLRRNWLLYLGSTAVLAAYTAFYLAIVSRGSDDPMFGVSPTASGLAEKMLIGLGQSVAPMSLGGPWFTDGQAVVARAAVPGLVAFLAIEVLALVLVAAVVIRRRGLGAILLLVVIIAGNLGLIAVARSAFGGVVPMQELRYFANLGVWVPLLVTLALVPARATGTTEPARYPAVLRGSVRSHPVVWALVAVVALNGALVTTYATAAQFRTGQAKDFLQRTLADLSTLGEVTVADRQLPPSVIPSILTGQTLASRVLSAATPRPSFDAPTSTLYAIAEDGSVTRARIDGGAVTAPGPDGACGTAIQSGDTQRLRLTDPLFNWHWWARVDYLAQSDTVLRVKAGDSVVGAPVARGPGALYVPLSGEVDDIFVTADAAGGACIAGIHVGLGVPDVEGPA